MPQDKRVTAYLGLLVALYRCVKLSSRVIIDDEMQTCERFDAGEDLAVELD